ncbi:MAG: hypothetical protein JWR19_2648 [Pedosphaera sp.]|nr:hypothetical protein [Pedosphaera sp.]
MGVVEGELDDLGMISEEGVDGAAEMADAFAVDDANLEDVFFLTGSEIIEDEVLHFAGLEAVQIQHAVDGEVDGVGIVHGILLRVRSSEASERDGAGRRPQATRESINSRLGRSFGLMVSG